MKRSGSSMTSTDVSGDYKELNPGAVAYYDGLVYVNSERDQADDRDAVPSKSNVYTIDEVNANLGRHSS